VAELDELATGHDIHDFTIVDANFIGTRSRPDDFVAEFCEAVGASGLDLVFDIATRVDTLTNRRIGQLWGAGMRRVFVGVESGDPARLRSWRKDLAPESSGAVLQELMAAGVYVSVGFIMLTPETTLSDIRSNIRFLRSLPVFGYYCLDKTLWPLHRTPRSFTVDASHLAPAGGRIYRSLVFQDPRVADYRRACGLLAATLGSFFDAGRERLWKSMGRSSGPIRLHAAWERDLVERYTDLAVQVLDRIEEGLRDEALADTVLGLAAEHEGIFAEALERFAIDIDARFPIDSRRGSGGLDLDGLICRCPS
jgi:hypothetical protein